MKDDNPAAAGARPTRPMFRRKKFVIKRAFQFKIAVIMFLLFTLSAFMVWWEVYSSFQDLIRQGLVHDPAAIRLVSDMTRVVLYKVIIGLVIVWFLALLLSHYLAGPLYRLEECLKLLRGGDLVHRARLRPHDELKGLAAVYNDSVEAIQKRVKAIKDAASQSGDARSALERIQALVNEFKI